MKTKIDRPGVWAVALCALALAGCDAVKDVRSKPATELPPDKEVLEGVIYGLGGGRGITLRYGDADSTARSFVGPDPDHSTAEPASIPFTFGSLDVGTAYNVVVSGQPFGKQCVAESGTTGTIAKGQATEVIIRCTPSIPRYDLTVQIPPTPAVFSGLPGAKVYLKTGEWMQERLVTPGQTSVTFDDALFSAAGQPAAFTYTVSASFVDPDGKESRCRVTNPTGSNPTANVVNPVVGASATTTQLACQFTISGSVAYSTPHGGSAETGVIPGGLLLEVRDVQAKVKASYEVGAYGNFTIGGTTNPTLFSSNIDSVYDIVVARQPTDRICVVGDGGAASLYRTGTNNPTDIKPIADPGAAAATRAWGSRLNVFCRARPAAARVLTGTYRLTSSTWHPLSTSASTDPVTVTYDNYDWTKQNIGSSNMLTFFDDGTFLYGTHANGWGNLEAGVPAVNYSVQVEHGFYDYDPDAGTVRYTLITDTNPHAVYPADFAASTSPAVAQSRVWTAGLSAAPGAVVNGTPAVGAGAGIWTAVMMGIQKSTVTFTEGRSAGAPQTLGRITGTFGTDPRLDWELTEPQSLNGEMTGTWITRDHRRFWAWDYLTYYGTHVGVLGGAPSMNDACFTVPEVTASKGVYTRRGSSTGCLTFNRPARGAAYTAGFAEAVDFHLTNTSASTNAFVGVAGLPNAAGTGVLAGSRLVPQFTGILPGYVGRIPGGNSAADGRSPSPIMFLIAPASDFANQAASTSFSEVGGVAATTFFDDLDAVGPFTDWCQTEILALRATLHGNPINYPVYFCRNRAP